jgi:hypothetical protein
MTVDILARLRSALGRTYSVQRELGRGGMAAVHQRPAPPRHGALLVRTSASGQPQAR